MSGSMREKRPGAWEIMSVTPYEVETYFRDLKKAGLGPKSIRQIRAVLHRACRLARKWSNGVLPNPIEDTEMPDWALHEQPTEVRAPTVDELRSILGRCRSRRAPPRGVHPPSRRVRSEAVRDLRAAVVRRGLCAAPDQDRSEHRPKRRRLPGPWPEKPSFDQSLFWLTRDDVGPNAIELFLKCAMLFCIAGFARDRRSRWLVAMLVLAFLGLWNKLNFVRTLDATVAVSVVAIRYRRLLRSHRRQVLTWVSGLVPMYVAFLIYYEAADIGALDGPSSPTTVLAHTWPRWLVGIKQVLSGTWFYDYALAGQPPRMLLV